MSLRAFDKIPFFILEESLFGRKEFSMRCPGHCLINFELSLVIMTHKESIDFSLGLSIICELFDNSFFFFGGFISNFRFLNVEPTIDLNISFFGISSVENEA